MKLCIVTHAVVRGDGQGRVNYEVTWEALRRGHAVTLVASSVAPDLLQHPQVQWISITVKQFPSALLKEIVFAQQSAKWLKQHRSEFDLVKVNGAITSASSDVNAVHFVHSAWLKSKVHPARSDRTPYGWYHWLYSALNAQWEKQAFRKTKVVVAVSEQVKREIVELGIPEASVKVILNGVDVDEFKPGRVSRQALNLPFGYPLALFAGDIRINRKNLDTVLHALVEVPSLHLAVVGMLEGSPYPQLAAELNIESRVHFLGYRNDIANVMKAADFFVFPSRYEPFGMVVLEAMASGIPVITSATAGVAECVTPECGVVLADPDDVIGLSQVLHELASNLRKCHTKGKAARATAEHHSWKSKANQYVELFEQLTFAKATVAENFGSTSKLQNIGVWR